jgi:hypothetical protein
VTDREAHSQAMDIRQTIALARDQVKILAEHVNNRGQEYSLLSACRAHLNSAIGDLDCFPEPPKEKFKP